MISKCYCNDMKTRTYIFVFRDVVKNTDYRASVDVPNLRNAFDFIEKVLFDKDLRLVNTYYVLSGSIVCLSRIRKFHFKGLAFDFFRPLDVFPDPSFELLHSRSKVVPDEYWN